MENWPYKDKEMAKNLLKTLCSNPVNTPVDEQWFLFKNLTLCNSTQMWMAWKCDADGFQ